MFTTNADHTAQQQHTNETTFNHDNNKDQQTSGWKVMFENTLYLTWVKFISQYS